MRKMIVALCLLFCAFIPTAVQAQGKITLYKVPNQMIDIGPIQEEILSKVVIKARLAVALGAKALFFRIDSPGGRVEAGMKFIQNIEELKKRNVRISCVVDTNASSMAFVILQAICDDRFTTKRATFLVHNVSNEYKIEKKTEFSLSLNEMKEQVQSLQALSDANVEICAPRMKLSVEELKAKIAAHAWIFGWQEALDVGAVDAYVDPMSLPPLMK